ncbi:hypothetical protein AURDEDRAFT_177687 [Auricularia subglabra TFB-10046 SS5]|uniref:Uncharacterized protein n=1 Tax=Auricularia subglabra (strain TFB-10046 / SS5) TaxID=717982 RepID=J0CSH0_AURST|nr:hypothetical protein AURDEDRAFT_177687 [Auricularia subglabra TFB-10046 SS5]
MFWAVVVDTRVNFVALLFSYFPRYLLAYPERTRFGKRLGKRVGNSVSRHRPGVHFHSASVTNTVALGMDGISGASHALGGQETGPMYELLRLYRDRDMRDAKILSLEQSLSAAKLAACAASGVGPDQTNESAQVQQLTESLRTQQAQLEELRSADCARTATIATLKASLDEKDSTIDGLKNIWRAQEGIAEQLQQELDQLRGQNAQIEETARERIAQLEEQLMVASANGDGNTLRDEPLGVTQEHAVLQQKQQEMGKQSSSAAGASSSEQVMTLISQLETLRESSKKALADKSSQLEEKARALDERNLALQHMQANVDDATKSAGTLGAQLDEANGTIQQLREDAHRRTVELEKVASRGAALRLDMDGLKRQLVIAHSHMMEAKRAAQQAIEEGETTKKQLADADARNATLESDLKESRWKESFGGQRIAGLLLEGKQLTAHVLESERERARLSNLLEAKTAEVVSLLSDSNDASSDLSGRMQKLTVCFTERVNEIAILKKAITERDRALTSRTEQLQQKSQELSAANTALRELRTRYEAMLPKLVQIFQAKLAQAVPKNQHDAQVSHPGSQLDAVRAQLAEAEARVSELDAQLLVTKNPGLGRPTPGTRIGSPIAPTPEPNASIEEIQLVKEPQERVQALENETAQFRSTSSAGVASTVNASGECNVHNTIADVLSTAKDKYDAARIWVTNMYMSDEASSIPQSDVFLAYHGDLNYHPRLTAADFFNVCEHVIPGVYIEKDVEAYIVKGMSKRRAPVRNSSELLLPRGSFAIIASPAPPVSATASAQPEKPITAVPPGKKELLDSGVQYDILDNPEVAASACHSRLRAWPADTHLDFKLWLRHHVLGLSRLACMHPNARTSEQALRRYLFARNAKDKVVSLGWCTEAPDIFRVPADSRGQLVGCL